MTIRNKDLYMSNLWDWGIFNGCFGNSRISITDLDGMVERNGKFLIIEAKSEDKPVPTGQRIMFENLAKLDCFTVIVLWGTPNNPVKYQQYFNQDGKPFASEIKECDLIDVRRIIKNWYLQANRRIR